MNPSKDAESPIQRMDVVADRPHDPGEPLAGAGGTPAPIRILVVDDNRDSADSLATILRRVGHEVWTAYDGLAAVETAVEHGAEAVLLDIGLPGVDGYEVARRIRQSPGGDRVHVIALTGWGQWEDQRRSSEAGFDAHLVKPVDPRALRELIERGARARVSAEPRLEPRATGVAIPD